MSAGQNKPNFTSLGNRVAACVVTNLSASRTGAGFSSIPMKEKDLTPAMGRYPIIARMPTTADVANLKVGDLAPDCFGRMSRVTRIFARKEDINGNLFVCYYCAMNENDTAENGCGCSASMKAGELVRTVALTGLLKSAECDALEEEMRGAL